MKRMILIISAVVLLIGIPFVPSAHSGWLDDVKKGIKDVGKSTETSETEKAIKQKQVEKESAKKESSQQTTPSKTEVRFMKFPWDVSIEDARRRLGKKYNVGKIKTTDLDNYFDLYRQWVKHTMSGKNTKELIANKTRYPRSNLLKVKYFTFKVSNNTTFNGGSMCWSVRSNKLIYCMLTLTSSRAFEPIIGKFDKRYGKAPRKGDWMRWGGEKYRVTVNIGHMFKDPVFCYYNRKQLKEMDLSIKKFMEDSLRNEKEKRKKDSDDI